MSRSGGFAGSPKLPCRVAIGRGLLNAAEWKWDRLLDGDFQPRVGGQSAFSNIELRTCLAVSRITCPAPFSRASELMKPLAWAKVM